MKCSSCGNEIPSAARFCPVCGSQLQLQEAPVATPPAPVSTPTPIPLAPTPKASRRKVYAIVAVVLGIVVIAALAGSYYAARGAALGLQPVCQTTTTTSVSSTEEIVHVEIGVKNPSDTDVTTKDTISFDYGSGVVISDTNTFTVYAHQTAYPVFNFVVTSSQAQQISGNNNPTITDDGYYSASFWTFPFHSQYQAQQPPSGGPTLPNC